MALAAREAGKCSFLDRQVMDYKWHLVTTYNYLMRIGVCVGRRVRRWPARDW
jgi:hypothetical protein